jgi:hypothetical protein
MKHLIMAIASLNAEIKKIQHRLSRDAYPADEREFFHGKLMGLDKAVEILTEQLREAQPDIVRELTQIRAIINKM